MKPDENNNDNKSYKKPSNKLKRHLDRRRSSD